MKEISVVPKVTVVVCVKTIVLVPNGTKAREFLWEWWPKQNPGWESVYMDAGVSAPSCIVIHPVGCNLEELSIQLQQELQLLLD